MISPILVTTNFVFPSDLKNLVGVAFTTAIKVRRVTYFPECHGPVLTPFREPSGQDFEKKLFDLGLAGTPFEFFAKRREKS